MEIQFYCPRWGSEALSWAAFGQKVSEAGYDGFEYGMAHNASEQEMHQVLSVAEKNKLKIIVQHYDTVEAEFSKHIELYSAWLEKVKSFPCVKINSQTGRDFFNMEQNSALIATATLFTRQTGVNVVHETHRNKFSFAAHTTKEYLHKIPDLKLTLDASHWVCVAESFLEDQAETMELAIQRTEHIHARVGYLCGPQIPDPRMPEWQHALNAHLSWWDKVVERKKKENTLLTIAPEFGPYPYMVHLPANSSPICNQWDVNVHMMELLRNRYN
ncbi:sugar phosphate isomerase/epimerase family protein [Solitalea lacus]|uniref:sugar phosphate isomerase/epimerase family protein n=1 Tax=Solitalea lacus TaxID=2911172 RepID=UPI001EDBEA90|nr:sugar phosphate isomerase/epimerase [Solitalea lacus]UKJ07959.1 sugar phosphate isomerase/epimerase [Solitalea lacus]